MQKSFINYLPHDCYHNVLNHLDLADVLRYGECSIQCLQDIEPSLRRKHDRIAVAASSGSSDAESFFHERVKCLDSSIPRSHSSSKYVRNLLAAIDTAAATTTNSPTDSASSSQTDQASDMKMTQALRNDIDNGDQSFLITEELLKHETYLKVHKLHSRILCSVTNSYVVRQQSPPSSHLQTFYRDNDRESVTTVTLDKYIGDVLCATLLIGDSVSNDMHHFSNSTLPVQPLVEQLFGENEYQWLERVITRINDDSNFSTTAHGRGSGSHRTAMTKSWYNIWIFLHSTLLRFMPPLDHDEWKSLGIPSLSSHLASYKNNGVAVKVKSSFHSSFLPTSKSILLIKKALFQISRIGCNSSTTCVPRFCFSDFGRLNETFRGRDRTQY